MKQYKRLAVFGGTFSPVHNGHLRALVAYVQCVLPDVVYVIPTAEPPHKERSDGATDAQRLEMLRMAMENLALPCEIVVSDIEMRRKGKSYTVHTVDALAELAEEIIIFCGTDMLLTLEKWYEAPRLLRTVSVAYMQREADGRLADVLAHKEKELALKYGTRFFPLSPIAIEISSTEIRDLVHHGENISKHVPQRVAEYIAKEGLYS